MGVAGGVAFAYKKGAMPRITKAQSSSKESAAIPPYIDSNRFR